MRALLAVLAILFPLTTVSAGDIVMRYADEAGNYVRLFDAPCSNGTIMARVPPQYRESMRSGEGKIDKKVYASCWVALDGERVGIIFDDGDQVVLPMAIFKPETNA